MKFWKKKHTKHSAAQTTESSSDSREYIAEALEPRILFSGAPIDTPVADVPTDDVSTQTEVTADFGDIEDFGTQSLPEVDIEETGSNSDHVILSNFDNLTAEEIKHLARITLDYWKDADLDEKQLEVITALESSLVDIISLADPSGNEFTFDSDRAGFYADDNLLDSDYDFGQSLTTTPQEMEQYGIEMITSLLLELGEPITFDRIETCYQITGPASPPFTYTTLDLIADAAEHAWISSGLNEEQRTALDSIQYHIAELDGATLGYAEGSNIYIDDDAAGFGWFIDQTPYDLSETDFYGIDLVSVMSHEIGHVLGLEHDDDNDDIMHDFFGVSERRTVESGQAIGSEALSLEGAHLATVSATWTGSGDGTSWTDPANWDGTAPSIHGTLTIDTTATIDNVSDTDATAGVRLYQNGNTFQGIINLNQGTIVLDQYFGTGSNGAFNIGDGSGNGDAIVNIVSGGQWQIDRHSNGVFTINIQSDGQLNAIGTGKFAAYKDHPGRSWEINVDGGLLTSESDWDMSDGPDDDVNHLNLSNGATVNVGAISVDEEVIDFTDTVPNPLSTFTADYGGSFADEASVLAAIGTTFTSSGGLTLQVTDHGTSFSVSAVPVVVYVDDSWSASSPGDIISDSDLGTNGEETAVYNVNAFGTIEAALAAVENGGTIIVNSGTYAADFVLNKDITFEITGADTAQTAEISGIISGTGALTKTGEGTLILSGANTYEGQSTIAEGVLKLGVSRVSGVSSALGVNSGKTVIQNGGTLDLNGFELRGEPVEVAGAGHLGQGAITNTGPSQTAAFDNITLIGDATISSPTSRTDLVGQLNMGGFTLTKIGGNSLYLKGLTITNTGDIDITAGRVDFETSTSFDQSGTVTIRTGATLELNRNEATHPLNLVLENNSTLTNRTYGSVDTTTEFTGSVTLVYGLANLTVSNTGGNPTTVLSGKISGTGGFRKAGPNTLIISGDSDYTGNTFVNAGTLLVDGDNSLATAAVNVANGATLGGSGTIGGTVLAATGSKILPGTNSTGTLTISAVTTISGDLTFDIENSNADKLDIDGDTILGGTLTVSATSPSDDVYIIVDNDGTLTGTFSNYALNEAIVPVDGVDYKILYNSGDGNDVLLVKADPTIFYVNDQWSGLATGRLVDGDIESTSTENAVVGYTAFGTIAEALAKLGSNPGTIVINGGDYSSESISLSAANITLQLVNDKDNSEATVSIGSLQAHGGDTIVLGNNGTGVNLAVGNNVADSTISAILSGPGSLIKTGSKILFLTGSSNTYTGGSVIEAGTLRIQTDRSLGDVPGSFDAGNVTINGGTLKNNGPSIVLDANRGVEIGSSNGRFDVRTGTEMTINGVISGSGSLETRDGGVLILTAQNTYTGSTEVNAGTLQVTTPGGLPGSVSIVSSSTLNLLSGSTNSYTNSISGSGRVLLTLSGSTANTYLSGNSSGFTGLLELETDGSATGNKLNTGGLNLSSNATIRANDGTQVFVVGTLANDLEITGDGNTENRGVIRFANNATITGDITLLGDSSFGTENATISGNILSGTTEAVTLTFGAPSQSGGTLQINGVITDSTSVVSITRTGSGTVALNQANTYSGTTTVESGTLLINADHGAAPGTVTVANGATLGGNNTVGGNVIIESGGTLSPGSSLGDEGTLTFNQDLSIAGDATLDISGTDISSHDVINVLGTLTLGGSLNLVDNGSDFTALAADSQIALITVSGTSPASVSGMFTGLPEGTAVSLGGAEFTISYTGGDGNDIVLVNQGVADTGIALNSGNLVITDTNGGDTDDSLRFTVGATGYTIYDGSQVITTGISGATRISEHEIFIPFSSISGTEIQIDTLGGSDVLTLDLGGGTLQQKIVFSGGAGTGDLLEIVNGTLGKVTHHMTGPDSGEIDLDSDASVEIEYTGLEPVDMSGSTATDIVLNLAGTSPHNAQLSDIGGGIFRFESTDATPTFESTDFAAPSGSLTINGDASDSITLSTAVTLNGDFTVNGATTHLSDAVTTSGNDQSYNGNVVLDANASIIADTLSVSGLNLGAHTLTTNIDATANLTGQVDVSGGGITKTGTSVMTISGQLSGTGFTGQINGGYVISNNLNSSSTLTSGDWIVESGATLNVLATGNTSGLGAGTVNVSLNGGELDIDGIGFTTSNALDHYGYHISNDGIMDLDNNGGMMSNGSPSTFSNFAGQTLFTTGPGNRGLDFNSDTDFSATGAVDQNDNFANLFLGYFTPDVTGDYSFRIAQQDDRTGIWIDTNQNGVFESTTPGVGSNRGEQLLFNSTTAQTVSLVAGQEYLIAFTHREGGGGSGIDARFTGPAGSAITSETIVKPGDASQAGMWRSFETINAPVTLTNNIVVTATDSTVDFDSNVELGDLTAGAGIEINFDSTGNASNLLDFTGATTLNGDANFDTVNNARVELNNISENAEANVSVKGTGIVFLPTANTYSGTTTISESATIDISHAMSLGDSASGTTVNSGASLRVSGGITVADESLTLNGGGNSLSDGALHSTTGDNDWTGTITLTGNTTIRTDANSLDLQGGIDGGSFEARFESVGTTRVQNSGISGTGSIRKEDDGTLELYVDSDYTGNTLIANGTIDIRTSNGLGTSAGSTSISSGGTLRLRDNITVSDNLNINGVGEGSQGAIRSAGGSNTITGNITLAGSSLIDSDSGSTLEISGVISGGGSLTKSDAGTLSLSNTNTYTGTTTIEGGTLEVKADGGLGTGAGGTELTFNSILVFDLPGDYTIDESLVLGPDTTVRNLNSSTNLASSSITLNGDVTIESATAGTTFSTDAAIDLGIFGLTVIGDGDTDLTGDISSATLLGPDANGNFYVSGLVETVYSGQNISNPTSGSLLGGPSLYNSVRAGESNFGSATVDNGASGPWTFVGNNETVVYTGQFYDADGVFSFAENIDDQVLVKVDDVDVLRNTVWNQPSTTGTTTNNSATGAGTLNFGSGPNGDGWHEIEFIFGGGGGGNGATSGNGWTSTFGFGLNVDGSTSNQGGDYIAPVDSGDGSLFRTIATGGIIKQGAGTLSLDGTNTYEGLTDIQEGTLQIGADNAAQTIAAPGGLKVDAAATLEVTITGTNTSDLINVTEGVTLNGNLSLQVDPANTIATGAEIIIISNDLLDPVNGTFNGLAEGAVITVNGHSYQISYSGGVDDNDVVLTALNDAPVLTTPGATTPVEELDDASAQDIAPITGSFTVEDTDFGDTYTMSAGTPTIVRSSGATVPAGVATELANALTLNAGTYTFDPGPLALDFLNEGETLTITFPVTANDGDTDSNTEDLVFTIIGTNDAAIANDDTNTVSEDGPPATDNVIDNDFDADDDATIEVIAVEGDNTSVGNTITLGSGAKVTLNQDGSYSYDPNGVFDYLADGESTTDSFEYTISDGYVTTARYIMVKNNGSDLRELHIGEIEVFGPGQIPAVDNALGTGPLNPDTDLATTINGALVYSKGADASYSPNHGGNDDLNLLNAQEDTQANTWGISGVGAYVIIDLGAEYEIGSVRVHQRNESGQEARLHDFTVTLFADDGGALGDEVISKSYPDQPATFGFGEVTFPGADTAEVTVTVTGQNDEPVAIDDTLTVNEDDSGLNVNVFDTSTATEVTLTNPEVIQGTSGHGGNIGGTLSDGFAYDPATPTATLPDQFFNSNSGDGYHNLGVGDVVISYDLTSPVTIDGENQFVIDLYGRSSSVERDNDIDIHYFNAAGESIGVVTGLSIPDSSPHHLRVSSLGHVLSGETIASFQLIGHDSDGNTADNNAFTLMEIRAAVITQDGDPDTSDTISIQSIDDSATRGSVTLVDAANGIINYDPNGQFESLAPGETATDTFTYTIVDDNGATDTATVTVTINGQNDAPTASGDTYTTDEDTVLTIGPATNPPSYAEVVRSDNPVAYYPLSTDGADNQGNYDGTSTNVTFGEPGIFPADDSDSADSQGAASFDGSTSRVTVPLDQAVNPEGSFTVETWAKWDGGGGFRAVLNTRDSSGGIEQGYIIYKSNTNQWEFWTGVGAGAGNWDISSGGAAVAGEWTHLVATFEQDGAGPDGDGVYTGTKKFYVNGVEVSSETGQRYLPNTVADLTIGAGGNDGDQFYFDGHIDEVAIYDQTLEASDVAARYAAAQNNGLLVNDQDPDVNGTAPDNSITVSSFDAVSTGGGTVSVNSDGSFTYDPNGAFDYLAVGETATDTFTYTIIDDSGATDTATVTITIRGVNDAPELADVAITSENEGTQTSLSGKIQDSDFNGIGYTVTVNWGDPNHTETIAYDLANLDPTDGTYDDTTGEFTLYHTYLDDDPNGDPSNDYSVSVQVWETLGYKLQALYNFDNAQTTDGTDNSNDGSIVGTLDFVDDTPNALNGGQSVSGTNDGYILVNNSASLESIDDQLTVSFWVKANAADNQNWVRLIRKGNSNTAVTTWMVNRYNNTSELGFRTDTEGVGGGGNQNRHYPSGDNVLDGEWHHVTYVLDSGSTKEYVDGVLNTSQSYSHGDGLSNTYDLRLMGLGGNDFYGQMDDIALYSRALSDSEVAQLAAAPVPTNVKSQVVDVTTTVTNVIPTVTINAIDPIDENGIAVLSGEVTDPGSLDSHTITIHWGDENDTVTSVFEIPAVLTVVNSETGETTLNLTSGQTFNSITPNDTDSVLEILTVNSDGSYTFQVGHQYLDDGVAGTPFDGSNGTASDNATISITVEDDDQLPTSPVSNDGLFNVSIYQIESGGTDASLDSASEAEGIWQSIDAGATAPGTVTVGSTTYNVTGYTSGTTTQANYGGGGDFTGDDGYGAIGDGSVTAASQLSVRAQAYLEFTVGGTYTIAAGSDDGRQISLTDALNQASGYSGFSAGGDQIDGGFIPGSTSVRFNGTTGHNQTLGVFTVNAGDILYLDSFFFERSGGDSFEISIANGSHTTFNAANFELLADGVLGIEVSSEGVPITNATSTAVTIQNTAPQVTLNAVSDIDENGIATLTGSVTDPGTLDSLHLTVDWGDPNNTSDSTFNIAAMFSIDPATGLTTQQLNINDTFDSLSDDSVLTITSVDAATGTFEFSVNRQYLDDGSSNPDYANGANGTAEDTFTITVSVVDDDQRSYESIVAGDPDLNGYWRFEENTGATTANDTSDNNYDGTVNGDTTFGQTSALTTLGSALTFDGNGDYIATGTTAGQLGFGGDFTASAWLMVDVHKQDNTIFGTDTSGTNNGLHLVIRNQKAHFGFFSNDVGGTQVLNIGEWYHVTWRFDTATNEQAIFINGELDNSRISPVGPFTGVAHNVNIGRWANGSYFDGMMDEVSVIGRALSNAEIEALAESGPSLPGTATTTVKVSDVAPQVTLNPVTAINENETATLTGTISDVGALDAQQVSINWGDANDTRDSVFELSARYEVDSATGELTQVLGTVGHTTFTSSDGAATLTVTGVNNTSGEITFTVDHTYLDDGAAGTPFGGANGTASDQVDISVTVLDDDSLSTTSTTSVTISNVAPTVSLNAITAITENGYAIAAGRITDQGRLDSHHIVIDWGDPNNTADSIFDLDALLSIDPATGATTALLAVNDTFTSSSDGTTLRITAVDIVAGTFDFEVARQYLDDGAAGSTFATGQNGTANDTFTVRISVNDDDFLTHESIVASDPDLTGFWRFQEDSGANTAHDSSGNGGEGTFQGDVDIAAGSVNANFGTAATFDGVSDAIATGRTAAELGFTGDFTASAWIYLNSTTGDQTIFGTESVGTNNALHLVIRGGRPHLGFFSNDLTGNTNLSSGQWHHITWQFDSSTNQQSIYVDGNFDKSRIAPSSFTGGSNEVILGHWRLGTNHYFNGMMDDVSVIGRVLTSEEISVLAAAGPNTPATASTTVTVNNADAELTLEPVTPIDENDSAAVKGTITDAGRLDSHQVIVNWDDPNDAGVATFDLSAIYSVNNANGDLTAELLPGAIIDSSSDDSRLTIDTIDTVTGVITFTVTHQYEDDGSAPGDTWASNTSNIVVSLADDDTSTDIENVSVVVNNVAPQIVNLSVVPAIIDASDSVTLTGDILDPGSLDVFTIQIDWADGSSDIITRPAGATDFSWTHQYDFKGDYTIQVTLLDDDNGSDTQTILVRVDNSPPTVELNPVTDITAGDTAVITGDFTDTGLAERHEIIIDFDDEAAPANATFDVAPTRDLSVGDRVNSSTDGSVLIITGIDLTTGEVKFRVDHTYPIDGIKDLTISVDDGAAIARDSAKVKVFYIRPFGDNPGVFRFEPGEPNLIGIISAFSNMSEHRLFSGFQVEGSIGDRLNNGSGQSFNGFSTLAPYLAGVSTPNAGINVIIRDLAGTPISNQFVRADMAGNWTSVFNGISLDNENYTIEIRTTPPVWSTTTSLKPAEVVTFNGMILGNPNAIEGLSPGQIIGSIILPTSIEAVIDKLIE
ncbi:MAG: autotransporter-associated beta strand repeat-containing protein [Verrucomicrobiales bacterium]|nr:autotransporter-associated beta strand repeat-containing protein [Verrucomicrobiales bacterium]